MHMKGGVVEGGEEEKLYLGDRVIGGTGLVVTDAKRVLVGAGARALFYPTLLYNVLRNRFQVEFHWWDKVDEAHGIDHLVIPTRDYCFAPSLHDICRAVDFLHGSSNEENASSGRTTYVHCKAGRGRSTTIVICYLVHHKMMTPNAAYDYIKSIRPRVLLASSQWQAVQEYYHLMVKQAVAYAPTANLVVRASEAAAASKDPPTFDDCSVVVVTASDLEGYDPSIQSGAVAREIWADPSFVYHFRVAGQAALAGMSWLRLGYVLQPKISANKMSRGNSCSVRTDHLGGISVDIHVY